MQRLQVLAAQLARSLSAVKTKMSAERFHLSRLAT
jgi:hypothetical protein